METVFDLKKGDTVWMAFPDGITPATIEQVQRKRLSLKVRYRNPQTGTEVSMAHPLKCFTTSQAEASEAYEKYHEEQKKTAL